MAGHDAPCRQACLGRTTHRNGWPMTSDRAFAESADEPALLITGAAGKTGGQPTRMLIERGHHVRAMVRRFDDRAAALRDAGAEVIVGDLTDINDVRKAAEGAR